MTEYECPKCGGSDYFMSQRNVMKGMGGLYGNRGGVKKFPVCRVCNEIMDKFGEVTEERWEPKKGTAGSAIKGMMILATGFFGLVLIVALFEWLATL
jgi:hypothetical protein